MLTRVANSVDPDHMASSKLSCYGSTVFSKRDRSGFSRAIVLKYTLLALTQSKSLLKLCKDVLWIIKVRIPGLNSRDVAIYMYIRQ